ncbi:MAG: hypothetical protein IJ202_01140 [Bacteroidales bacterium]|nr:hypothetical protein [Bacteroidales bacterium]
MNFPQRHFPRNAIMLLLAGMMAMPAAAQDSKTDYDRYMEKAGVNLPALKTKRALRYNFAFNGTPYYTPDGFKKGDVSICGKVYRDFLVNYNCNLQVLEVRQEKSPLTRTYDADDIEWFTMGERTFVNLAKKGYSVPNGFFEVIYEGKENLYRRIDKPLEVNTSTNFAVNIGYTDPGYRDNVVEYFNFKESWYLEEEEGSVYSFRKNNIFFKKHPGSRRIANRNLPVYSESDHAVWFRSLMEMIEKQEGR